MEMGQDGSLDRRSVLGIALGGTAAAFAGAPLIAKPAGSRTGIIDVHQHIVPPALSEFIRGDTGWSARAAIEGMDSAGIATAIASAGPVLGPDLARRPALARSVNDFGAKLVQDYSGRFGSFAALPLPDVPAAMVEVDHSLDQLGADGFGIASSYGDKWLGDETFWPLWEKLDARAAVIFVHPQDAACCGPSSMTYSRPKTPGPVITGAWIEWPMNTARTILSLMTSGTLRRFPRIRFIFAHGGGVMPLLVERIAGFDGSPTGAGRQKAYFPNGIAAEFASLHFECAQAYAHPNIDALRALVPDTKLLFGSDFPAFPLQHVATQFTALKLPETARYAIARGNAVALLPRWA